MHKKVLDQGTCIILYILYIFSVDTQQFDQTLSQQLNSENVHVNMAKTIGYAVEPLYNGHH